MYQDTDFVSNLRHVATQGDLIHSRGLKAVEVTAFTHLFNAESFEGYRFEDLVILHPARNLRVRYQWAEACYFWLGLKDDTLFKFSKTAGSMMSADSEYGGRIRTGLAGRRSGLGPNVDQLKAVIDRLESDPDTRQAVISIYHAGDLLFDNDVPCTLSIQFLLRDGELNAICTMRSNDILLGHTLDVFNVRLWQTLLSKILNVHVGYLVWQVGSMHLYIDEKSQDTAKQIIAMPSLIDNDRSVEHRTISDAFYRTVLTRPLDYNSPASDRLQVIDSLVESFYLKVITGAQL